MIIVFDVETGGLGKETSLLTAYFGVFDVDFNFVEELDLRVKPEDGKYIIEPRAMEINKIDLATHDKEAITYKEAKSVLYKFLSDNYIRTGEHLIPLGHSVSYDIEKITSTIISKETWDNFVGYRKIDTGGISKFLQMANILPKNLDAGLDKLVEYFKIPIDGELHTAKTDARLTFEVFKKLVALTRKLRGPETDYIPK